MRMVYIKVLTKPDRQTPSISLFVCPMHHVAWVQKGKSVDTLNKM